MALRRHCKLFQVFRRFYVNYNLWLNIRILPLKISNYEEEWLYLRKNWSRIGISWKNPPYTFTTDTLVVEFPIRKIVLKLGWFTTLDIRECERFIFLVCPLRFLVISAMRPPGNVQSFKTYMFRFLLWTRPRLGGLSHLDTFTWQIVTPADRVTLPGRPGTRLGGPPHLSCKRDQSKIRNYVDRRITSPTWGPPPPCKQALNV